MSATAPRWSSPDDSHPHRGEYSSRTHSVPATGSKPLQLDDEGVRFPTITTSIYQESAEQAPVVLLLCGGVPGEAHLRLEEAEELLVNLQAAVEALQPTPTAGTVRP